jgi:hypothetical protein
MGWKYQGYEDLIWFLFLRDLGYSCEDRIFCVETYILISKHAVNSVTNKEYTLSVCHLTSRKCQSIKAMEIGRETLEELER